jgi:hypothetical protein
MSRCRRDANQCLAEIFAFTQRHSTYAQSYLEKHPARLSSRRLASKRLFEWTEVHLLRPCRALLPMDISIGVTEGVDAKQAGLAAFRGDLVLTNFESQTSSACFAYSRRKASTRAREAD